MTAPISPSVSRLAWWTTVMVTVLSVLRVGGETRPIVPTNSSIPAPSQTPPLPPPWVSPVDYFRKLLAADDTTRHQMLATKSPAQQRVLLNSLREYESLTPEMIESRLQALDLRAFLTPLLHLSPSNRADRIALIPGSFRAVIVDRLQVWDSLPANTQRLVLDNQSLLRLLVSSTRPLRSPVDITLSKIDPDQLKRLEADIFRWRQLPSDTRTRVYELFCRLFDAPSSDRTNLFSPLNQAEMKQIQTAIDKFHKLPKVERDRCLEGFQKFTELSPSERRQFLVNAAFWQRLSPQDRQLWRDLVNRFPPYPPGFGAPPLPPASHQRSPSTLATTNR